MDGGESKKRGKEEEEDEDVGKMEALRELWMR